MKRRGFLKFLPAIAAVPVIAKDIIAEETPKSELAKKAYKESPKLPEGETYNNLVFEIKGERLIGVIKKAERRNNRLNGSA